MKKFLLFILIFVSFASFASNNKEGYTLGKFKHEKYYHKKLQVTNIDEFSYVGVTYSNFSKYNLPTFGAEYVSKPFKFSEIRVLAGASYSADFGKATSYESAFSLYLGGVFYNFFKFAVITRNLNPVKGHNKINYGGLVGVQVPIWDNRICFGVFTNSMDRNYTATIAIAIK